MARWTFPSFKQLGRKLFRSRTEHDGLPNGPTSVSDWKRMLAAAADHVTSLDFVALRRAYARSVAYHPYEENEDAHAALQRALQAGDDQAAIATLNALLERDYINISTHLAAMATYERFPDRQKRAFHACGSRAG